MAASNYLFTSESVSEGHPDKVCDRISDAVVDAFLTADPEARVACETLTTTNRIVLAGEVRGPAPLVDGSGNIDKARVEEIARAVCAVSMDDVGLRALRAFSASRWPRAFLPATSQSATGAALNASLPDQGSASVQAWLPSQLQM